MPLGASIRNQITGQIDAIFDAIAAGTAFENQTWEHQSFGFSAGGRTYVVMCRPGGDARYAQVVVTIKRIPT